MKIQVISFIVLIVLLAFFFNAYLKEREKRIETEQGLEASVKVSNILKTENDFYKNKKGDTVLITKTILVPSKHTEPIFEQSNMEGFKKLESIKKDGSNLINASTFTSEFTLLNEDGKEIILKDSTRLKWFRLVDSYNNINVLMADTSKLVIKNRFWQASSIVRKKRWFIKFQWSKAKKFEIVSEVVDSNIRARIDSLTTITIK